MHLNHTSRGLRSALILILCGLYFVLAMGITLLASGVYRDTVESADRNYAQRTALSYLINQVRRSDTDGSVAVGSFGESDALVLRDGPYVTILYCYDGQLRELYTEEGSGLTAQDGLPILPLASLTLSFTESGISITATDQDGAAYSAVVLPRCGYSGVGKVKV